MKDGNLLTDITSGASNFAGKVSFITLCDVMSLLLSNLSVFTGDRCSQ